MIIESKHTKPIRRKLAPVERIISQIKRQSNSYACFFTSMTLSALISVIVYVFMSILSSVNGISRVSVAKLASSFSQLSSLTLKRKNSSRTHSIVNRIGLCLLLVTSAQSSSFNYTGSVQQLTIPSDCNAVHVILCGAAGGVSGTSLLPGYGAKVQATVSVTPSSTLYIYVGGQPVLSGDDASAAGYNGGGAGFYPGTGGGGSSDLRTDSADISSRIVVAGGGGGYSTTCSVQSGSAGQVGLTGCDGNLFSGGGATQSTAGNSGSGGIGDGDNGSLGFGGAAYQGDGSAGGGGGGYYGGGGGAADATSGGGGGGSSYAADMGAVFTAGYCTGNGFVVVTFLKSPSSQPSRQPSRQPSAQPSTIPTRQPSRQPTSQPSARPSTHPTMQPSRMPTNQPTGQPSRRPTSQPSRQPTRQPTMQPSQQPYSRPSGQPSRQPTSQPSRVPSCQPTMQPSRKPTMQPSRQPSSQPTSQPSSQPVMHPSAIPSSVPSRQPSRTPSCQPTAQPSRHPTMQPSRQPSRQPTMQPSLQPFSKPTGVPSRQPTMQPSRQPTQQPTGQPSRRPTSQPTRQPYMAPSGQPSRQPFSRPSGQPSVQPTFQPSRMPSTQPSSRPTRQPTMQPSRQPTVQPTGQPSGQPVSHPSGQPSRHPTMQPSRMPTAQPSFQPSRRPTSQPSRQPSRQPTMQPSLQPVSHPSGQPSRHPSMQPSRMPSMQPTCQPTRQPSMQPSSQPSRQPTAQPTRVPTMQPTAQPSRQPTSQPTRLPTQQPTSQPSRHPTQQPTSQPSKRPSMQPTRVPTEQPTRQPSQQPTTQPSSHPSRQPTSQPSRRPTQQPTVQPSSQPSSQPSRHPTCQPSAQPSVQPSSQPTRIPSRQPTAQPSRLPTSQPSSAPSRQPSAQPSSHPSEQPSAQPSSQPSGQPSSQPSRQPSSQPTSHPSMQPTDRPSMQPSSQPSVQPSSQPSSQPSGRPTDQPTSQPSLQPSSQPSGRPSMQPTSRPSMQPSRRPTSQPSRQPSTQPSGFPSSQPSSQPSGVPTRQPSSKPSQQPSGRPSMQPTSRPSMQPSGQPTSSPSEQPTVQPSMQPSSQPSRHPTMQPSRQPTSRPSRQPTRVPTNQPSSNPTNPTGQPSGQPSRRPTMQPSRQPTRRPTAQPSRNPSRQPSAQPSRRPSSQPSRCPTSQPSGQPSRRPTAQPSRQPSQQPTSQPSRRPTTQPSRQPLGVPSSQPSVQPSDMPTGVPSAQPSGQPSGIPSRQPSRQPTRQPSSRPSSQPSRRPSSQPSRQPTSQPSGQPSKHPTSQPSRVPSAQPSAVPTRQPTGQPSRQPSGQPTRQPTRNPTEQPTTQPSFQPSVQPSRQPSGQPSGIPSGQPTGCPSAQPSKLPSSQPSRQPTAQPSVQPTRQPTSQPTRLPTSQPSSRPTVQPSTQPTKQPLGTPSSQPTRLPTSQPSRQPSLQPTSQPSRRPSRQPSAHPSRQPSAQPTKLPSRQPSAVPTKQPTQQPSSHPSGQPTGKPSFQPSGVPSRQPSEQPTGVPSVQPSRQPSRQPTSRPSSRPTDQPSRQPTHSPSTQPSMQPTRQPYSRPTGQPSRRPSMQPTGQPSRLPTMQPSRQPSTQPSASPSRQPTMQPSRQPTSRPTMQPSRMPTAQPSLQPSRKPTGQPSRQPSAQPSKVPSVQPSGQPSVQPSSRPTDQPTRRPSSQPSHQPSEQPSSRPTDQPSSQPSRVPSCQPSAQPSRQPSSQPSASPTRQPSSQPSRVPTRQPTGQPSRRPTSQPSVRPSSQPSAQPSRRPSTQPSSRPSRQPSSQPSSSPTRQPSGQPSRQPSCQPTGQPSRSPTRQPTRRPTSQPSSSPTMVPSLQPFSSPTSQPSAQPTGEPSGQPSISPSMQPSSQPTIDPTGRPSSQPSVVPSAQPSAVPSSQPSGQPVSHPTGQPSKQPFMHPSCRPTSQPSALPSHQPSIQPSSQPSLPLSGSYVPIVGLKNVPLVGSLSSSLAKYSLMIEVSLYVKEDTTVYCAAYPSAATYSQPATTAEIIAKDFRTLASESLVSVMITGLSPATEYNVFCMTVSLSGSQMPYYEMITHEVVATTLCCKVFSIDLLQPNVYAMSTLYNAVSLQMLTAPTSHVTIALSLQSNTSNASLGRNTSLTPSVFSLSSVSPVSTIYYPVLSIGSLAAGYYKLSASVTGDSAAEYEVDFTPQNLLRVLSTTTAPPAPVVSNARFTPDGLSVMLTFSAPTNQNNVKNAFACSSLLTFKSMTGSSCIWTDSAHISIYFSSSVASSQLLTVGDTIAVKGGLIRAACSSANVTRCTSYPSMASQNVTVLAPTSPTVPNVVISGPSLLGVCSSMPMDLTFSTGNAGRDWAAVTYRVLDSVDRLAVSIEAFLRVNYTFQAPGNVIPASLFVRGHHYTFQVTLCNFLSACGSGSLDVFVSNATDTAIPVVSILGSTSFSTVAYAPLSIIATAFTQSCSGSKVYSGLTYSWSSVALVVPTGTNATTLTSISNNPLVFKLSAYILVPKVQYKITLTATSSATLESASASAIVTVTSGDVIARIAGSGSSHFLLPGHFLLVDASSSFDSNFGPGSVSNAGLLYSWSCGELSPVYNATLCDLRLAGTSSSVLNITAPFTAVVSVAYRLTVTVRSTDGRLSSAFVDVTIVDSPYNALSITVPNAIATTSTAYKVNTNVRTMLVASARVVSPCLAVWTVDDPSVNLPQIALVPVNSTLQLGFSTYSLLLGANTLSQRASYQFTLQCSGSASLATVTLVTNGAPLAGSFAVSPDSGFALQTVFVFSASYWTDEDLPLSYQVAYLEPSESSSASISQVVVSKSFVSASSSLLPAGSTARANSVTVVLTVYDLYDASSSATSDVTVVAVSSGDQSNAIDSLLSTIADGNIDNSKQVLAVISSSLNIVNCSTAIDCSSLNRNPCSATSFTCGSCLDGFIGDAGDSNAPCAPDNDTSAIEAIVCSVDADCGNAWYQCQTAQCTLKSKECTQACSGRGLCEYHNTNSNTQVPDCLVSDPSCDAVCQCDANLYGSSCELTFEELKEQYCQHSALASILQNITALDDVSESNIAGWSTSLYSITTNPYQVSGSDAATMSRIADYIVSSANSEGLQQYESILPVLTSIDALSSLTSYFEISCSSEVTEAAVVNNTPGSSIVSVVGQFGSLIGSQMVYGQEPTEYVYDNFRLVVQVQSLSSDVNISSPQTDLEVQVGSTPSGVVIGSQFNGNRRQLADTASSGSGLVATSLIETKMKTFGTTIVQKLNSNAFYLSLSGVDDSLASSDAILDSIDHVEFYFANVELKESYRSGYQVNFTTVCNGVTDIANYSFVCEDSGTELVHSCTGTVGTFITYCPVAHPICDYLSLNGMVAELFEVTSCSVQSYSEYYTVCECAVDGTHHRRHLSGSFEDTTPQTNAAFDGDSTTLMGSAKTFVPSSIPPTFVELVENPSSDPQVVFGIVLLYSCLMFVSLMSIGWKRYGSSRSGKTKKKIVPSILWNKDQNAMLSVVVQPPSSDLNNAEIGVSASEKRSDLHRQMSDYVFSLLPAVFRNTRSASLGKMSFLSCVWSEFARHHRYFTLWSHSYGTPEHMMSLARVYTTVSFLIFCVVLLMSFQSLADDHHCKHHFNEQSCLTQHTWIDTRDTYCKWEPDPTAPNPSTAVFVCNYKTPGFTAYVLLVIILISAGAVAAFSFLLDYMLRVVFQSTLYPNDRPLWKQLTESKKIQVKPTEDFENPRSPKSNAAKKEEAEQAVCRYVPSEVEASRAAINEAFTRFKEENFNSGRRMSEFVSPSRLPARFSRMKSGFSDDQDEVENVEENRQGDNGTMQLSSLFNYYPILEEVIRERETFDHHENVLKAILDRLANQKRLKEERQHAEEEEAEIRMQLQHSLSLISSDDSSEDSDSSSEDDLFSGAPVSVQRRLAESLVMGSISKAIHKTVNPDEVDPLEQEVVVSEKVPSHSEEKLEDLDSARPVTNPVIELFEQQWGIEGSYSHHYRIREEIRTAIMSDVQASDVLTAHLLHTVMKDGSDAHYGLNVVQQLMLDLLERDSAAEKIVVKKFHRDFPPLMLVSGWFRTSVARFLVVLNVFFCVFCIYWTIERSMYWQYNFLSLIGILLVSELLVFASIECLLMHVVIPNTVRPHWNKCVTVLNKLISDLTAPPPDEATVVPVKKYLLNAATHLFVAHKLATQYQLLFESKLVLLYATELPGRLCRHWHPEGSLFVPPVEVNNVIKNSPGGKRVSWLRTTNYFTAVLTSVIVYFSSRLSGETELFVLRLTPVAWFGGLAYAWFWFVAHSNLIAYILVGFALAEFLLYAVSACVVYVKACDACYEPPSEKTATSKVGVAPITDASDPDVIVDAAEPIDLVEARRASFKVPLIDFSSSDDSEKKSDHLQEGKEETDEFDVDGLRKNDVDGNDLSPNKGKKNRISFMTGSLTMSDDEDESEQHEAPKTSVDSLIQATKQRRETMLTGGVLPFSPTKQQVGLGGRRSFMPVPLHFQGIKGINDRIRKDAMQFSDGEEEDEEDLEEGGDTFEYTPNNRAAPIEETAGGGHSTADELISTLKTRRETMRSTMMSALPPIGSASPLRGVVGGVSPLNPTPGKKDRRSFMELPSNFKGKQGLPAQLRKDAMELSDDEGEDEEEHAHLPLETIDVDESDLFDDDIHGPESGGKALHQHHHHHDHHQLNSDSLVDDDHSMMLDEMSLQMESTIAEEEMSDSSGEEDDQSVGSTRRTLVVKELIKIFEPDERGGNNNGGGDSKKQKKKTVRMSHVETAKMVKTLPALPEIHTVHEDEEEDERFESELRPSSVASNKRPTSVSNTRAAQQVNSSVDSLLQSVKNRRITMNAAHSSPVRETSFHSPHGADGGFESGGSHRLGPLAPVIDRRSTRLSPALSPAAGGIGGGFLGQPSPGRQSVLVNSGRMSLMGNTGVSGGTNGGSGGVSPGRSSFLAGPLPAINAHSVKRPMPALVQPIRHAEEDEDADSDGLEVLEL